MLPQYRADVVVPVGHGDRQRRLAPEIRRVYRRPVRQQPFHHGAPVVPHRAVQRRTHTHIAAARQHRFRQLNVTAQCRMKQDGKPVYPTSSPRPSMAAE